MRVVFLGSADLSCASLSALLDEAAFEVCAVVTQPDRPCGRGRKSLRACPAKQVAEDAGITVLCPENINDPDVVREIAGYGPDVIVVVAYGQMLKQQILQIPPRGCINLHASLLPRYRGAAPIHWAIVNGDEITGVTTMYIDEQMDAGDMIMDKKVKIGPDDTAGTMHDKLAAEGAILLIETMNAVAAGTAARIPQDHDKATMAPKLSKADGCIDWTLPAEQLRNRIRGFNPWPGCWARVNSEGGTMNDDCGEMLKIWKAELVEKKGRPGEIMEVSGEGPVVAAGDKSLRLIEVQPENGNIMSGADYARGHLKK